jgi:hypothetical protein
MISPNYRFDDFLAFIKNAAHSEALELADQESRAVKGTIVGMHSDTLMENEKVVYYRKLRAFCFFFAHGVKPEGFTDAEFRSLGRLCEQWAGSRELPAAFMAHFRMNTHRGRRLLVA